MNESNFFTDQGRDRRYRDGRKFVAGVSATTAWLS